MPALVNLSRMHYGKIHPALSHTRKPMVNCCKIY